MASQTLVGTKSPGMGLFMTDTSKKSRYGNGKVIKVPVKETEDHAMKEELDVQRKLVKMLESKVGTLSEKLGSATMELSSCKEELYQFKSEVTVLRSNSEAQRDIQGTLRSLRLEVDQARGRELNAQKALNEETAEIRRLRDLVDQQKTDIEHIQSERSRAEIEWKNAMEQIVRENVEIEKRKEELEIELDSEKNERQTLLKNAQGLVVQFERDSIAKVESEEKMLMMEKDFHDKSEVDKKRFERFSKEIDKLEREKRQTVAHLHARDQENYMLREALRKLGEAGEDELQNIEMRKNLGTVNENGRTNNNMSYGQNPQNNNQQFYQQYNHQNNQQFASNQNSATGDQLPSVVSQYLEATAPVEEMHNDQGENTPANQVEYTQNQAVAVNTNGTPVNPQQQIQNQQNHRNTPGKATPVTNPNQKNQGSYSRRPSQNGNAMTAGTSQNQPASSSRAGNPQAQPKKQPTPVPARKTPNNAKQSPTFGADVVISGALPSQISGTRNTQQQKTTNLHALTKERLRNQVQGADQAGPAPGEIQKIDPNRKRDFVPPTGKPGFATRGAPIAGAQNIGVDGGNLDTSVHSENFQTTFQRVVEKNRTGNLPSKASNAAPKVVQLPKGKAVANQAPLTQPQNVNKTSGGYQPRSNMHNYNEHNIYSANNDDEYYGGGGNDDDYGGLPDEDDVSDCNKMLLLKFMAFQNIS